MRSVYKALLKSPEIVAALLLWTALTTGLLIVTCLRSLYGESEFWENLLVEGHGIVVDLALFTIVISLILGALKNRSWGPAWGFIHSRLSEYVSDLVTSAPSVGSVSTTKFVAEFEDTFAFYPAILNPGAKEDVLSWRHYEDMKDFAPNQLASIPKRLQELQQFSKRLDTLEHLIIPVANEALGPAILRDIFALRDSLNQCIASYERYSTSQDFSNLMLFESVLYSRTKGLGRKLVSEATRTLTLDEWDLQQTESIQMAFERAEVKRESFEAKIEHLKRGK